MLPRLDLSVDRDWKLLHKNFSLNLPGVSALARSLPVESGLYLWTVRLGENEHSLYLGKSKIISRRIYSYTQSFQPHAPNDRKIFFAQEAIKRLKENVSFPLYWRPVSLTELETLEVSEIKRFEPVLNTRRNYSEEHAKRLLDAHAALYQELIENYFHEA